MEVPPNRFGGRSAYTYIHCDFYRIGLPFGLIQVFAHSGRKTYSQRFVDRSRQLPHCLSQGFFLPSTKAFRGPSVKVIVIRQHLRPFSWRGQRLWDLCRVWCYPIWLGLPQDLFLKLFVSCLLCSLRINIEIFLTCGCNVLLLLRWLRFRCSGSSSSSLSRGS